MKIYRSTYITLLCMVSVTLLWNKSNAQDTTYTQGDCISRSGVSGAVLYNPTTVHLNNLDGVPTCCTLFETGSGAGASLSGEYMYVIKPRVSIGVQAGVMYSNSNITANETRTSLYQNVEQNVFIEHRINGSLLDVVAAPFAEYRLDNVIPIRLGVMAHKSIYTHFEQSEKIVSPDEIVYENNRKDRLNYSGTIPLLTAMRFDAFVSFGYVVPVSKNNVWTLIPRVELSFPFFSVVQNGKWNIASAGVGVSLLHNMYDVRMHITNPPPPPLPIIKPEPKPVEKPTPVLTASVSLHTSINGEKVTSLNLQSKAKQAAFPLLPYIFFDDTVSTLASRYVQLNTSETQTFSYRNLDNVPDLERYRHILNIIGKRMQEYPKVSIVIRGCNSNTNKETNNTQLSMARATTVKEYLTTVWGIEAKRMKLESRNLPDQFSNPKTPDGIEENRRVEIIPSSMELDLPVITNDTTFVSTQASFVAIPTVKAEAGVKQWDIRFEQQGKLLWYAQGNGNIPESFEIPINDTTAPHYGNNVQLLLSVTDNNGQKVNAVDRIQVPVYQDSSVFRKQFTLVLFDFNSADLTPLNKRVAEMVKQQLKVNSHVEITGFADRTGNLEYNKKLALRRSDALAKHLKLSNAVISAYDGTLLINNDLPEGRYFCRTVRVNIEDKR